MHNKAQPYNIHKFGTNDALTKLPSSTQQKYLLCYLAELEAVSVLEEPNYFDRDYLAEFSAFYSTSTRGYSNLCRRVHFFNINVTRDKIRRAASGSARVLKILQEAYLGFVIIRPIPSTPLGRTVLRWYDEQFPSTPRVTSPSRPYHVHFTGITLTVTGLAWQQQDSAVGACATVGLWSMLHSSAFDDHHAIPTTAEITQAAHKRASLGARIFPSGGLTIYQICEAIKEQNLSPVLMEGDIKNSSGHIIGFGKERFSSSCAAFIRSGYPVIIIGTRGSEGHAICVVGFRSPPSNVGSSLIELQDANIRYLYIHDDNLGPSVRFSIEEILDDDGDEDTPNDDGGEDTPDDGGENNILPIVALRPDAPPPRKPNPSVTCPTDNFVDFIPKQILVAVHNDLRTYPDNLHKAGLRHAIRLNNILLPVAAQLGAEPDTLVISTRFVKLAEYLGTELSTTLSVKPSISGKDRPILGRVRLMLSEKVAPMSLHIGLVRIGKQDSSLSIDILYDTTDSDINHPIYATVIYDPTIGRIIEMLVDADLGDCGVLVNAF